MLVYKYKFLNTINTHIYIYVKVGLVCSFILYNNKCSLNAFSLYYSINNPGNFLFLLTHQRIFAKMFVNVCVLNF